MSVFATARASELLPAIFEDLAALGLSSVPATASIITPFPSLRAAACGLKDETISCSNEAHEALHAAKTCSCDFNAV